MTKLLSRRNSIICVITSWYYFYDILVGKIFYIQLNQDYELKVFLVGRAFFRES